MTLYYIAIHYVVAPMVSFINGARRDGGVHAAIYSQAS